MPEAPLQFFIQLADGIRGPVPTSVLRELAEAGVISPATHVSDGPNGPWKALCGHVINSEVFPPRRTFSFRATEFDSANPSASSIDHIEIIRAANQKPALKLQASLPSVEPTDIQRMVSESAAKSLAHEKPMVFVKRPNKRLRDYLLLIGIGDGLALAVMLNLPHGSILLFFSVGFSLVYTWSLTWVMWFVMGRY